MNKRENFSIAQTTDSDSQSKIFNIDVLCINCNEMINVEEIGFFLYFFQIYYE